MSSISLGFVGDLHINRDDPLAVFNEAEAALRHADILFGNLEGAYTDEPHPVPSALGIVAAPTHNAHAFSAAGFKVLSLANNHILDVGYGAMIETRSLLRSTGVATCGAGEDPGDAHAPAIVDCRGRKVGFLSYTSTFPMGYDTRPGRPGVAALRAYNHWRDPFPSQHDPGAQPFASTIVDPHDLAQLERDIIDTRARCDILVASFHWGDYTRPYHLTDHELRSARHCIDLGVDIVVGHHHHALRGFEWYKGKPIAYGLGHFVFDRPLQMSEGQFDAMMIELDPDGILRRSPYRMGPREGWPWLPMHEDTRMTALALVTVTGRGSIDLTILPCMLAPDGHVHPVCARSPDGEAVIAYIERCNAYHDLNAVISVDDVKVAGLHVARILPDETRT